MTDELQSRRACRTRRRGAAAVPLALLCTAFASGDIAMAASGTLTYVKDGNVFVSPAEGGAAAQVTSDGSAAAPYAWGSQSAAGLVVAARGATALRRAQSGQSLGPPLGFADEVESGGSVSPDGRALAYVTWKFPCRSILPRACLFTDLTPLVAGTPALGGGEDVKNPVWANDTEVIGTANGAVRRLRRDRPGDETWIPNDLSHTIGPADAAAATADGTRLVIGFSYASTRRVMTLITTPGFGGAATVRCRQALPAGPEFHPVWSPNGSALAWEEANGIWTEDIVDLSGSDAGCAVNAATARLVIPGGRRPQWSSAPYDPRPLPDRDGDVLPDAYDTCPDAPASSADGCPPPPRAGATPPPAIQPPARPSVRVAGAPRLRRAIRSGLPLTVTCPASCAARVTAGVSAATAKRLRLGRRSVNVASGELRSVQGSARLNLTFARRLRARLNRARSVHLTIVASFGLSTGPTAAATDVTLR